MSTEMEYKSIKGQALSIIKEDGVANAEFAFIANEKKHILTLLDIQDIVDVSHLIETKEFWIDSHPEKNGKFVLTLHHEYGVEIEISNYAINS